jgi:4-amino-4-deoxy-L-arabinose transferase-like glycosyltransferase
MFYLKTFGRIGTLVSLLLLVVAGLALLAQQPANLIGLLPMLLGLIGFGGFSEWLRHRPADIGIDLSNLLQRGSGRLPRFVRYLPFAGGLLMLGWAIAAHKEAELLPWGLLAIWLSGMVLVQAGSLAFAATREQQPDDTEPWSNWEIPLLTLLALVAFALRASMNDRIPFAVHGDEGEMGLVARSVIAGRTQQPFATEWLGHPTIWFFIQAAGLSIFGDTISGLRTVSALFGTATVLITYLFARSSFGRPIAIGSSILLAGLPYHIHFSRVGLNNIADPTLGTASFALLLYGWRRGNPFALLASGLTLGLAQHFYFGARLSIVMMALLVVHLLISQRARLLVHVRELLLLAIGFLAGVGPLLRFYLEAPHLYTERMGQLGFFREDYLARRISEGETMPGIVVSQLLRGLGAYTTTTDVGLFYAAPQAMLSGLAAVVFICGFSIALWQLREARWFLMVMLVIGTAIFGGAMLMDVPQLTRYLIVAPVVSILVMYGLQRILTQLWALLGIPRGQNMLAWLLCGMIALQGVSFYFGRYTREYIYAGSPAQTQMGYYMQSRSDNDYVFFLTAPYNYHNYGTIAFLAPQAHSSDVLEPISSVEHVPATTDGKRAIFLAVPARQEELKLVAARYPGGQTQVVANLRDPSQIAYVLYITP